MKSRGWEKYSVRLVLVGWAGLAVAGWLGYLPFLAGFPGFHWLALAYSALLPLTVVLVLGSLFILPTTGFAFAILGLISLKQAWRRRARNAMRKLLGLLLVLAMAIGALLPSLMLLYVPYATLNIAPWHTVYRAIYVSPVDNNYGDLMLLKCRWLGICHQVYRSYTDITSAEETFLEYNGAMNQVALHLEGRWVYVRSPKTQACKEFLRSSDSYGKCSFDPEA